MKDNVILMEIDKPLYETIHSVQYDRNSRFLHVKLLNNSLPFDLTNKRVILSGSKPDGQEIFNTCKIEEGLVIIEITEEMNAIPGTSKYSLEIYGGDMSLLQTKNFKIRVTPSNRSKAIESRSEVKALNDLISEVQNIDNRFNKTNAKLTEVANKGTTVEVIERVTKEEIDRQIEDGTMANLTLADNSITGAKIQNHTITKDKIHPDVRLGVQINDETTSGAETWSSEKINSISLKVRDLRVGESVVNISAITGDKYLEALFDFNGLSAETTKVTDKKDNSKFFSLSKVEPAKDGGAYVLGYNGQLVNNPQSYAVGLIFRGDNEANRTGIFKFSGDDNTAINVERLGVAFTHKSYYCTLENVPLDLDTYMFLLVGIDMPNNTMNIWVNGVKKATCSLGGRKIGNIGYLNKGYWSDGKFIFDKIALFNKANFTDRELKAITEHIFTTRYLNVNTSKSFLSLKNGLVRHLTMKNNTDGVIKDVVYKDTVRNTTSVTAQGFVLSERTSLGPSYSILNNKGCVFIRFDKTTAAGNKYLLKIDGTLYLWVDFNSNKICSRLDSEWLIGERSITLNEKNVLCFTNNKVFFNGICISTHNVNLQRLNSLIGDVKNEYPIKDYVVYSESLSEDEIKIISNELCSY